ELGNRTQGAVLIREKRAVSERALNGTRDLARYVDRGESYAYKYFALQVGNVIGGNEVNEIISVGLARLGPRTCGNFASRVAADNPGDAQDDEFHQRLAGGSATGVYGGIIPTHDHRRRRQSTAATLKIDPREEVERRFSKMNMRGLARSRSRFVVDWAVERNEHDKNRIAPLVLLHLARDFLSHHSGTQQVEHEMSRVHIRDDQLTHR